jgi:hypothetical protein
MDAVTLLECERCTLAWVQGTERISDTCPACTLRHSIALAPVVVAGREVPVTAVRVFGFKAGLEDWRARDAVARLKLGQCAHGYISEMICPECRGRYLQH